MQNSRLLTPLACIRFLLVAIVPFATCTLLKAATADLQLSLKASPNPVVLGGNLTYEYTITNHGPDTATQVLLTDLLPPNLIVSSVVATNGSWLDRDGVFEWSLSSLPTGLSIHLELMVTPVDLQMITNRCWVQAAEADPTPWDNQFFGALVFVLPVAPGANLQIGRDHHVATRLMDGRVLLTGGGTGNMPYVATETAELYDPTLEVFALTGNMTVPRYNHTATLLTNGMVLVAGGNTAAVDLYDPTNGTFTFITNLSVPRSGHSATLLPDGRVLLAGGHVDSVAAEAYDPSDGRLTVLGNLLHPRSEHVAELLPDGRVLFAGGVVADPLSAEILDPQTGISVGTASLVTNHPSLTGVRLLDGRILVAGGTNTQVFDPITEEFLLTPPVLIPRNSTCATRLSDGRVLLSGGVNGMGAMNTTETFDPVTATFSAGPVMTRARISHSATLLNDGRVLLAGGWDGLLLDSSEIIALTLDKDFDGMADDWELIYGFDPGDRDDAIADADSDGHSNLQEHLAGTNPLDPASVMRISTVQLDSNVVRISFTTVSGKRYAVERTTDFLSADWERITNNVTGTGTIVQVQDAQPSSESRVLYRVRLIP